MTYRIILDDLDFNFCFLEAYTDLAKSLDPYHEELKEDKKENFCAFVDLDDTIWNGINNGRYHRETICWDLRYIDRDEEIPAVYKGDEIPKSEKINTGSITFNDDETREGSIIVANGDGEWVSKENLDNIKLRVAGLEAYHGKYSGMTLEEFRKNNWDVIHFSKNEKNED